MITSYTASDRPNLYLSVVGKLDEASARALVVEYQQRSHARVHHCVLDLSEAHPVDQVGLIALEFLAAQAAKDNVRLVLMPEGSPSEVDILRAAGPCDLTIMDRSELQQSWFV